MNFQTAVAVDLKNVDDAGVLTIAADDGRVLVSHDRRTMPGNFAAFIETRKSPDVIIVSQRMPIAQVIEELLLIWYASTPDEWINRITHLPV